MTPATSEVDANPHPCEPPLVTVVLPVRDEAEYVGAALDSLAAQDLGAERIEVLVYDGMSSDDTRAECEARAARAPWARFEVLDNRERTVPHALNAGLKRAQGRWFTRVDGRTALSPGYLRTCVAAVDGASPVTAAGGHLRAIAEGRMAEAIAAVVTHPLGVGNGFRIASNEVTAVPHHPFAVWRTDSVRELGGFNPELVRNQDDEFSMRAALGGAEIFMLPTVAVTYRPRERLRGLTTQYFQYGLWKASVGRRAGLFPRRSVVPALIAVGAAGSVATAIVRREPRPLLALAGAYVTAGAWISSQRADADALRTAAALATLHLSYGVGVLSGASSPRLADSSLGRIRVR